MSDINDELVDAIDDRMRRFVAPLKQTVDMLAQRNALRVRARSALMESGRTKPTATRA